MLTRVASHVSTVQSCARLIMMAIDRPACYKWFWLYVTISLPPQFFWSVPIIFIAIRVFRPTMNAVKKVSEYAHACNKSAITIVLLFGLLCYNYTNYIHERTKQYNVYSCMMSIIYIYIYILLVVVITESCWQDQVLLFNSRKMIN